MYKILAIIYNSVYKIYNNLFFHKTQILGIYINISIYIKTLDIVYLSKYAMKVIKYEIMINDNHFIDINNKYDNNNISIMFTISFKSRDGYRAEEVKLYSKDYDTINDIDYNHLYDKLLFELDSAVERYRIEYFESINIKIL
jgi:hypothetical protein